MADDQLSEDLPPTESDWHRLIRRFMKWADGNEDVRAAAVIGSRARDDRPADEWSDLDLLLFVNDPARFVGDASWLDDLGNVWVTLAHEGPIPGVRARHVLFEGGLDVDFVPLPLGSLRNLISVPGARESIGKGFLPVVDKDGELRSVDLSIAEPTPQQALQESEYLWVIDDFLFQVVWATKRLRRGELWLAKDDLDCYMKKSLLLRMIESHALLNGVDVASWGPSSFGRLLEEWAAPWIVEALPGVFAAYDAADVGRALLEMMELFRKVAIEVADLAGYRYPDRAHHAVRSWAEAQLAAEAAQGET